MAREISVIYKSLENAFVAQAASLGISINPSNWSIFDYKKMFLDLFATSQGIQEQLYDANVEDVENVLKILSPQTPEYIKDKLINVFEFNSSTVPIAKLDTKTFIPYYDNPNPNQRIIKYVACISGKNATSLIKIAGESGGSPVAITGDALSSVQTFVNNFLFPGLEYKVSSQNSDKLFMQLDVEFDGRYSAVIQDNVINAIKSFLLDISTNKFNGKFILSDLFYAIKKVTGVIDVYFLNVTPRSDSATVGTGTSVVINGTWNNIDYEMVSGYMIPENTTGGNWRLQDYRVGSSGLKNLNLISI